MLNDMVDLRLGYHHGSYENGDWPGPVYEMMFFIDNLTDIERNNMIDYLVTKHSIQLV